MQTGTIFSGGAVLFSLGAVKPSADILRRTTAVTFSCVVLAKQLKTYSFFAENFQKQNYTD